MVMNDNQKLPRVTDYDSILARQPGVRATVLSTVSHLAIMVRTGGGLIQLRPHETYAGKAEIERRVRKVVADG